MPRSLVFAAFLAFASVVCGAQQPNTTTPKPAPTPKKVDKKPKDNGVVPLSNIVQVVELVVDAYNSRPETQPPNPTLPPLATADFDFKTVVDVKGGPSVNFWIFKAGYTHEQQRTNDVTFTYKPQAFKPGGHFAAAVKPEDLQDELTKAINGAANQIKGEKADDKSPIPLQLKSLAVTLAFQVSNDYTGGLNIPIHMVTLGGTLDKNNSATQTVKLTFSFPDAKP